MPWPRFPDPRSALARRQELPQGQAGEAAAQDRGAVLG